jgi:uncharacterized RDD family membrane protein YckC
VYQAAYDPTAQMGKRTGAWLIDFVFASILAVATFSFAVEGYSDISGNLCDQTGPADQPEELVCEQELLGQQGWAIYDEASDTSLFFESANLWMPVVAFIGYGVVSFVLVEGIAGASLGKLITGLRVVTVEGRRAGLGRSAVRFALWLIDGIPCCIPLVAPIAGYSTKGHRRVGDLAAGTFVVDKRFEGQPLSIPGVNAPTLAPYVPPGAYGAGGPLPGQQGATPWPPPQPPPTGATPPPWAPAASPSPAPPPGAASPAGGEPSSGTGSVAPPDQEWVHTTEPQWDEARDTYIQWDEFRQAWLQWDPGAATWKPIDQ